MFNIYKVDATEQKIYLTATSEAKDAKNEIMDYAGSKAYFENWSDSFCQNTGGKSFGNVRLQHNILTPIGKISDPLEFDDIAKTIKVVVKVLDASAWGMVEEGVLTGASIGGSLVGKRWYDPAMQAMRYIINPFELSLVDKPCNPDSRFIMIKADGTNELRDFNTKIKEQPMSELNLTPEVIVVPEVQQAAEVINEVAAPEVIDVEAPEVVKVDGISEVTPDVVAEVVAEPAVAAEVITKVVAEVVTEFVEAAVVVETIVTDVVNDVEKAAVSTVEVVETIVKTVEPEAINLETPDITKAGAKHSKSHVEELQKVSHGLIQMGMGCSCPQCSGKYTPADTIHKVDSAIDNIALTARFDALEKAFNDLSTQNGELVLKVQGLEAQPDDTNAPSAYAAAEKVIVGLETPAIQKAAESILTPAQQSQQNLANAWQLIQANPVSK